MARNMRREGLHHAAQRHCDTGLSRAPDDPRDATAHEALSQFVRLGAAGARQLQLVIAARAERVESHVSSGASAPGARRTGRSRGHRLTE